MSIGSPPLFPSDPVPAIDDVRANLKHVEPIIRRCILRAFATLRGMTTVDLAVADALDYMQTRAKVLNSLVVAFVRREFNGSIDGAEIHDENGFLELRVGDTIDLRFKLVDECGRSSNAQTEAQKQYRNQLSFLGSDVLDIIRLTVGWRWDETATAVADVVIAFEKGDQPAWVYSIFNGCNDPDSQLPLRRTNDTPRPARVHARGRNNDNDVKSG